MGHFRYGGRLEKWAIYHERRAEWGGDKERKIENTACKKRERHRETDRETDREARQW